MGSGTEERAGLMGGEGGGKGGQHAIDVQGSGLPPRWLVLVSFELVFSLTLLLSQGGYHGRDRGHSQPLASKA